MNHGQGKTFSVLLFMMLNAMLNAYLAHQARGGSQVLRNQRIFALNSVSPQEMRQNVVWRWWIASSCCCP